MGAGGMTRFSPGARKDSWRAGSSRIGGAFHRAIGDHFDLTVPAISRCGLKVRRELLSECDRQGWLVDHDLIFATHRRGCRRGRAPADTALLAVVVMMLEVPGRRDTGSTLCRDQAAYLQNRTRGTVSKPSEPARLPLRLAWASVFHVPFSSNVFQLAVEAEYCRPARLIEYGRDLPASPG